MGVYQTWSGSRSRLVCRAWAKTKPSTDSINRLCWIQFTCVGILARFHVLVSNFFAARLIDLLMVSRNESHYWCCHSKFCLNSHGPWESKCYYPKTLLLNCCFFQVSHCTNSGMKSSEYKITVLSTWVACFVSPFAFVAFYN